MSELLDIIISAIDEASSVFESITGSAEDTRDSLTGLSDSASDVPTGAMDGLASSADGAEQEIQETDDAINNMNNDLGIINSSMLLQLGEQVGQIGTQAEGMAQEMNTAAISVGQLATQTGIAEPEMVSLINTISNATFPNDEAMMYVKSLDQMGVSSSNLGKSATDLDKINDAFHLGADKTNRLGQELGVLGVDMNNVSSSFNALAYANKNTVGGMDNYFSFLQRYDSQFKELGLNVDQASIVIAGATHKFGGGRAALTGLSDALKESNGDTRALEQSLGLQAGSLENATEITGQYEGKLQNLANEESDHKTLVDQIGAAWEDLSLSLTPVMGPLTSIIGLMGQIGSFGFQISGLKTLIGMVKEFNIVQTITNAIEGEGLIARIASAIGITTEAAAAEGATVAFGGLAIAEGAALWPILAIIAAIGLLVVAVFEIGKAFGWWNDVGSMLDAIWSGIQRLWNAFINHPDVQAAIEMITGAWNALVGAVTWAWNAVMEFFGVNTGGEFDIVRALIEGIGAAWEAITFPIRLIIGLIEYLTGAFSGAGDGLGWLQSTFMSVWNAIWGFFGPIIQQIGGLVTGLMDIFKQFLNGQIDLPTMVSLALALLGQVYNNIFNYIISAVASFASNIFSRAVKAGSNFVKGIVNQIRALPGKVYSFLVAVVGRISTAIRLWINKAVAMVRELIHKIISPFTGLAGKIGDALGGVANALSGPFKTAWRIIGPIYNKIKDGIDFVSKHLSFGGEPAYGGEPAAYAGETITQLATNVTSDYTVDETPVVIEHDMTVRLDFANVPSQIDTNTLASLITDKGVLQALTSNNTFQSLDSKAKEKINMKINRARGI